MGAFLYTMGCIYFHSDSPTDVQAGLENIGRLAVGGRLYSRASSSAALSQCMRAGSQPWPGTRRQASETLAGTIYGLR